MSAIYNFQYNYYPTEAIGDNIKDRLLLQKPVKYIHINIEYVLTGNEEQGQFLELNEDFSYVATEQGLRLYITSIQKKWELVNIVDYDELETACWNHYNTIGKRQ